MKRLRAVRVIEVEGDEDWVRKMLAASLSAQTPLVLDKGFVREIVRIVAEAEDV